jgi:hypothetical protein
LASTGLDAEDSMALDHPMAMTGDAVADELDVAVVRLPRISNFTDFDPLRIEAGVRVRYVHDRAGLGDPDLIVLPGSKATVDDLAWLRRGGLDRTIDNSRAVVLGICGGYQMMGTSIDDPVECHTGLVEGLNLLPVATQFRAEKVTVLRGYGGRASRRRLPDPPRPRASGTAASRLSLSTISTATASTVSAPALDSERRCTGCFGGGRFSPSLPRRCRRSSRQAFRERRTFLRQRASTPRRTRRCARRTPRPDRHRDAHRPGNPVDAGGPMTASVVDVVAAVQSRVPYLRCATDAPAAEGWITCADLIGDPDRLRAEIDATAVGRETDDPQVAASLYAQSYAFRMPSGCWPTPASCPRWRKHAWSTATW